MSLPVYEAETSRYWVFKHVVEPVSDSLDCALWPSDGRKCRQPCGLEDVGGEKPGTSGPSPRTLSGHDVVVGSSVGRGGVRLFAQLRKAHGKLDE